jgi:hypothetical protein
MMDKEIAPADTRRFPAPYSHIREGTLIACICSMLLLDTRVVIFINVLLILVKPFGHFITKKNSTKTKIY